MSNIVTAVFAAGSCGAVTSPLFQWDYGQVLQFQGLELPDTYEVHFANAPHGDATTAIGDESGVPIPDIYLTTGQPVYAWIYVHTGADDGETVYQVTIPVIQRPKPGDGEPSPVEQSVITQAIAALNAGVTRAETAAESAEDDAILSESWAVGGTGTRPGEDTDNAKHYAEVAQQGAEEAGYAWFDINDETGEMMVTVTDNLAEDVSFAINENIGILEVTVNG